MEEGGENKRSINWERILEIGFAVVIIIAIGIWVIIDQKSRNDAPQPTTKQEPAPIQPSKLGLIYVTNGLAQVTNIASAKGDERLFIAEQRGTVRVLDKGILQDKPILDIQKKTKNNGEMGLIGLAFDPSFQTNGFVYVHYSDIKDGSSVIARYTMSADKSMIDPNSEKVILRQTQPYPNHNGGQLAFGPDGYLYIGFGDGGSGGDPQNYGQNMNSWLGKILRIDINKGDPYTVPADNPYVNSQSGASVAKPEIWASGLRNPWRFSFDFSTKQLIIADVGQDKYEEVNVEKLGKGGNNYGWRCYEGNQPFNTAGCQPISSYTAPRFAYEHTPPKGKGRCSITGGLVYRGNTLVGFNGRYLFADFCTGEIWSMSLRDTKEEPRLETKTGLSISVFGEDNSKRVYIADYKTGSVYKFVPNNPSE